MTPSTITNALQRNSREQEAAVRSAEKALSSARELGIALEQRVLNCLGEIASVQLENPTQCTSEVRSEMNQRRDAENQLRAELSSTEISISNLNEMERALNADLETLVGQVNQALAGDETYLQLVDRKMKAAEAARRHEQSRVEIKSECAGKMDAYQQPVFVYLRAAKFGTEEYRSRFLIRALERWLAAKSNYLENASNYSMLSAMLAGVDERSRELKAEFEEADAALKRRVDSAMAAAGVPGQQGRLDAIRGKISDSKQTANVMHRRLSDFAAGRDSHSQRAHEILMRSMKGMSFTDIQDLVSRSASTRDDSAAAQLRSLNLQLENHRKDIPRLEAELEEAVNAYERAKKLERNLRDSDYTSSGTRYRDDLDISSLIIGYMAGELSSSRVADQVRSSREVERHTTYRSDDDNDRGGFGFGGGGSSFSTSGSIGGDSGSFSTSDSF